MTVRLSRATRSFETASIAPSRISLCPLPTYSFYERGGEELPGTYRFIDRTPKGRMEA
jgi:predicted dithiol-disulfide oxidoreductase (DUF899 family)